MKMEATELLEFEKALTPEILKKQEEYIEKGAVKFECVGGFKKEVAEKEDDEFTVTVSL